MTDWLPKLVTQIYIWANFIFPHDFQNSKWFTFMGYYNYHFIIIIKKILAGRSWVIDSSSQVGQ